MSKQYTIEEAQNRVKELKKEIDYLSILIDENVRKNRDIYLDAAPSSLVPILIRELDKRNIEKRQLSEWVDKHLRNIKFEFDYEEE